MAPCELFEETKINYGKHRRQTIFASCDFCFVYFLNQEQVRFFRYISKSDSIGTENLLFIFLKYYR